MLLLLLGLVLKDLSTLDISLYICFANPNSLALFLITARPHSSLNDGMETRVLFG